MLDNKKLLSMCVVLAAAVTGCGKKLSVQVDCEAKTREAITCDVKQTAGTEEAEACWDLKAECPNGAIVTGPRTCQKVKGGGTETATILTSSMENVENCQGGKPKLLLTALTINGKQAN